MMSIGMIILPRAIIKYIKEEFSTIAEEVD
jgi:hypothetical protein